MTLPLWFMRLFRLHRPVMEFPATPFLNYWPGEIVRHMGRARQEGEGFVAGCVEDAGRNFVVIRWEGDQVDRITDPAALELIRKEPLPNLAQL